MPGFGKKPPPPEHDLNSEELTKSYVISLAIAIPLLVIFVVLYYYHAGTGAARIIFWMILFVSVGNFLALIMLEEFRSKMGSFTIPSLLSAAALVLLVVLVEGINRFIPMFNFHWLFSLVAVVVIFKYLALFKEKNLALKFYLAVNIVALAALWNLGLDDKIALPF